MPGDFDMFSPSSVHQKCVHHTGNIHFIGRTRICSPCKIVFEILQLPNDDKLTMMCVRILLQMIVFC